MAMTAAPIITATLHNRRWYEYSHRGGKVEGYRGELEIDGHVWHTTEAHCPRRLPTGWHFDLQFGVMANGTKALRLLWPDGTSSANIQQDRPEMWWSLSRGRMYMHPANWPHQLDGCVAPGCGWGHDGVTESRRAMGEIFAALGGWQLNKPAGKLYVRQ